MVELDTRAAHTLWKATCQFLIKFHVPYYQPVSPLGSSVEEDMDNNETRGIVQAFVNSCIGSHGVS